MIAGNSSVFANFFLYSKNVTLKLTLGISIEISIYNDRKIILQYAFLKAVFLVKTSLHWQIHKYISICISFPVKHDLVLKFRGELQNGKGFHSGFHDRMLLELLSFYTTSQAVHQPLNSTCNLF